MYNTFLRSNVFHIFDLCKTLVIKKIEHFCYCVHASRMIDFFLVSKKYLEISI